LCIGIINVCFCTKMQFCLRLNLGWREPSSILRRQRAGRWASQPSLPDPSSGPSSFSQTLTSDCVDEIRFTTNVRNNTILVVISANVLGFVNNNCLMPSVLKELPISSFSSIFLPAFAPQNLLKFVNKQVHRTNCMRLCTSAE